MNIIGRICVNEHGRLGTVEQLRPDSQGTVYLGTRLFGNGRWKSRNPLVLTPEDEAGVRGKASKAPRKDDKPAPSPAPSPKAERPPRVPTTRSRHPENERPEEE